jgi:choline monooxygenase
MRTPAFDQGRIVFDPARAGSGLSEHGVHHFHGLILEAYRSLAELEQPAALEAAGA